MIKIPPTLRDFVRILSVSAVLAVPCLAQQPVDLAVQSADKFLSTLSEAQRAKVLYDFHDNTQRARWSNFPTGFVPRGGINLKQMSAVQKTAALDLMKTVLSSRGYEKVSQIRMADDDFKTNGSKRGPRGNGSAPGGGPPPNRQGSPPLGAGGPPRKGGPGGGPPQFDSDNMFGGDLYYISFLGKPSTTSPWMLQFGGHHLALNITIVGSKGIMTPSLTGAQPAVFKVDGKTIRPLGRESDEALTLLESLDAKQRSQAVLSYKVVDLVLGPGQDGKQMSPEGLRVSAMNDRQKVLLLQVIAEWAGIMNDSMASARIAQLKSELNDTWFAWSGPTDLQVGTNINAYYRIQGPHLVIEYAPQSDEPTNHVHTIYRDPTNDYGQGVIGK
ncbi:DUF3500 domain-containing protein [Tunturiibacter lichenicola]|uniref:DUF3500 domain-containing protein n=1 Tax=Tunturiibacter lichenicola TaxID=2051959 RepID=UPI003D9B82D3